MSTRALGSPWREVASVGAACLGASLAAGFSCANTGTVSCAHAHRHLQETARKVAFIVILDEGIRDGRRRRGMRQGAASNAVCGRTMRMDFDLDHGLVLLVRTPA